MRVCGPKNAEGIQCENCEIVHINCKSYFFTARHYRATLHDTATPQSCNLRQPVVCNVASSQPTLVGYILSCTSDMETKGVVEALIVEVRKRTCLWDKRDDYYKNRLTVDKMWDEVAEAVNKSKDQVKLKWRNLRDQFHRELKKNPVSEAGSPKVDQYSGKWMYYEMLTFLKDHMIVKPPGENRAYEKDEDSLDNEDDISIVIKQDPDFDETIHIEPDNFLDPLEPYEDTSDSIMTPVVESKETRKRRQIKSPKRAKIRHILEDQRQTEIQNRRLQTAALLGREVDEDVHFALSLVPYLRKLDPLRKLIVRNEMQNLLIGELLSDAQTSSKPTD